MPSVLVLLPFRGGCEYRERALRWVAAQYAGQNPDWDLDVALHPHSIPWCKAMAVNPALQRASAEIVVVADADVWCQETAAAVEAVRAGAAWAVPHRGVFRLTEEGTGRLLDGEVEWGPLDQNAYLGTLGGGIVVARRETLLDCPLDPRFLGWGHEDECWGIALSALHGRPWRGKVPLVHLWHPPQQRLTRRKGSAPSMNLHRRYSAAVDDPDRIRRLLAEVADDSRSDDQHPLHDPPPLGVR